MKNPKDTKQRYYTYATVVYPDSEDYKDNWIQILDDMHIPVIISPLHDSDMDEDGKAKKPHYHVMFCYETLKSREQALEAIEAIGGVGCEVCKSKRGYARYLCHLDSPHKFKYDEKDLTLLGGVDYYAIVNLPSDKYAILGEIIDYIAFHKIESILTIYDYARSSDLYDWYRTILDNTYVINAFCNANYKKRMIEKNGDYFNFK